MNVTGSAEVLQARAQQRRHERWTPEVLEAYQAQGDPATIGPAVYHSRP